MYNASAFEFYLTVVNAYSVWVLVGNQVLCSIYPCSCSFGKLLGVIVLGACSGKCVWLWLTLD